MSSAGGRTDAGHAYGMRPDSEACLQMFGMHQKPCKLVSERIQSEKHADSDIVYASLHGPVHGFRMPGIVALGSGRMKRLVSVLAIRLLKEYVCAYPGFFQPAVILRRGGGDVHVHPADGPVPVMRSVNRGYGLQNIFQRIVYRILP